MWSFLVQGLSAQTQMEALEEKTLQDASGDMIDLLAYMINKISCEVCFFGCYNNNYKLNDDKSLFHILL